jgi:hypothetical protein
MMDPEIQVGHNKHGPVYIARQHNDGEPHNGYAKGDRVQVKDTDDLDSVYHFARGEKGTVICTFPSICEGRVNVFVSLDMDKGRWPEADEGEIFSDDALAKIID